jgi:hypothetical protein
VNAKSYEWDPATHIGPESRRAAPKGGDEALTGERAGRVFSRVSDGYPALARFRSQVGRLWHRALSRRSQNGRVLWDRIGRLMDRWVPPPSVFHPYPLRRMGVLT